MAHRPRQLIVDEVTMNDPVPTVPLDLDVDEQFLSDPWSVWDRIRRQHGAFRAMPGTPNGESVWVCTRESVIRDGYALGPEYFSNAILFPYREPGPRQLGLVEMDPPLHTGLRKAMSPLFSPRVVEAQRPRMHETAREIIAEFVDDGECEFVSQFAKPYVARIFLTYLGVPMDELDTMLRWGYDAVHLSNETDPDGSRRRAAFVGVGELMTEIADERRVDPRDDLITEMVRVADEVQLSEEDLTGTFRVLFFGGLDTTAGSLSFAARHFAEHPADRAILRADPQAVLNGAEEVLRAFGILNATKLVIKDVELAGCPMKAGDRVVFATSSAGRDEQVYPDANEFRLDRDSYRHIAFGLGPHRCIGGHFARAELQVFLEEWHRAIPEYEIPNPDDIHSHGGIVMGIDSLPLRWPT
jgi:cytochrome P450